MVGDTVNLAFVVLFAPDFGNEVATFWVAVATPDAKDSAIANVGPQRGRQCLILVVMQHDISLIVSSLSEALRPADKMHVKRQRIILRR